MTVKQLQEILDEADPEAIVVTTSSFDHYYRMAGAASKVMAATRKDGGLDIEGEYSVWYGKENMSPDEEGPVEVFLIV